MSGVRQYAFDDLANWLRRMRLTSIVFSAVLLATVLVGCFQTAPEAEPVGTQFRPVTVTPATVTPDASSTPTPPPTPTSSGELLKPRDTVDATVVPPDLSSTSDRFIDVAEEVGLDFQHGAFRWEVSADPIAMMGGGLAFAGQRRRRNAK